MGGILVIFSAAVEVAPKRWRASAQASLLAGWAFGSLVIIAAAAILVPLVSWRWLVAVASLPTLLGSLLLLLIDDSPRFLAASGKTLEARKVLEKMANRNRVPLPTYRLLTPPPTSSASVSVLTLLRPPLALRTIALCLLWFNAGCSYYGAVLLAAQLPLVRYPCLQQPASQSKLPDGLQDDVSCCVPLTGEVFTTMAISACGDFLQVSGRRERQSFYSLEQLSNVIFYQNNIFSRLWRQLMV